MTKNEMVQIMAVITAAYPRFYDKQTEEDKMAALKLWYRHFENIDYDVMVQAVDAVIATNKFPPTIAEINEKIDLLLGKGLNYMSEQEAWGYVSKAIQNSAYNYQSEFDKLPEDIQRIIHHPRQLREWALLDKEVVQSVIASNFQRAFRVQQEKKKQRLSLPNERQQYLQQQMKYLAEMKGMDEYDK